METQGNSLNLVLLMDNYNSTYNWVLKKKDSLSKAICVLKGQFAL